MQASDDDGDGDEVDPGDQRTTREEKKIGTAEIVLPLVQGISTFEL